MIVSINVAVVPVLSVINEIFAFPDQFQTKNRLVSKDLLIIYTLISRGRFTSCFMCKAWDINVPKFQNMLMMDLIDEC